jgi:hypothetical protein
MTDRFTTPEHFRQHLLDALLAHAATLPAADSMPTPGGRAARRRARLRVMSRRLLPALALAAILAAVVLVLRSGGVLRPQPATAAGVLNASATALGHEGGSRALTPGEYFYSRMAVWWRYAGFSRNPYIVRSVQESWVARDGRGRTHYHVIGLSGTDANESLPFARSEDTQQRRPQARPFILSTVPIPGIVLSYAQLRRLPTNPSRLAAAMDRLAARFHVDRSFPQRDIRTAIRFEMLRGLAEAPTSASLRAALYRVLAATPGIRLLGRTRDSIGRDGMSLAVSVEDVRLELIIDPTTGELLQTSRTLLRRSRAYLDGKQPPGLINRATYLADAIVPSTHARAR